MASDKNSTEFNVAVRTRDFTGITTASTYFNGSPSIMFAEMAKEWRGWKGTKSWRDLDGYVFFEAECDKLGHIKLVVELTGQNDESKLRVLFCFDSGQLDAMYQSIKDLLG